MSTNEVKVKYEDEYEHDHSNTHYEYHHVPAFNNCTKIAIIITGFAAGIATCATTIYLGEEVGERIIRGFFNLAYHYKREYILRETPEQEDEDEQSDALDSSEE